MNETIAVLEKYGFVFPERISSSLSKLPMKEIRIIRDELANSIGPSVNPIEEATGEQTIPAPFNFLASASFRGDAGCQCEDCQKKRLVRRIHG